MRDQPGQHIESDYKGFKPFGKPGWPGGPPAEVMLPLHHNEEKGLYYFLDAPVDSILWWAVFYDENAAWRVFNYLAKGNLLDAKI